MLEGERCPDCKGRGVVRRRPGDVPDEPIEAARETALADKTKAELLAIADELALAIADELGLEIPKRPTKAALVEAIEAEQKRLAVQPARTPIDSEDSSQLP